MPFAFADVFATRPPSGDPLAVAEVHVAGDEIELIGSCVIVADGHLQV